MSHWREIRRFWRRMRRRPARDRLAWHDHRNGPRQETGHGLPPPSSTPCGSRPSSFLPRHGSAATLSLAPRRPAEGGFRDRTASARPVPTAGGQGRGDWADMQRQAFSTDRVPERHRPEPGDRRVNGRRPDATAARRRLFSTEDVPVREQFDLWRELGERYLVSPRWTRKGARARSLSGRHGGAAARRRALRRHPQRGAPHRDRPGRLGAQRRRCLHRRAGDRGARPLRDRPRRARLPAGRPRGPRARRALPRGGTERLGDAHLGRSAPAPRTPAARRKPALAPHPAPRRDGGALASAAAEAIAAQADQLEPAATDAVVDNFCRLLAIAVGVRPDALEGGREPCVPRPSSAPDATSTCTWPTTGLRRRGARGRRIRAAAAAPVRAPGRELRPPRHPPAPGRGADRPGRALPASRHRPRARLGLRQPALVYRAFRKPTALPPASSAAQAISGG